MLKAGFSLILQKHALSCLFGGRDSFLFYVMEEENKWSKIGFLLFFSRVILPSPISNHHVQCQGLTQRLSKTVERIYSTYVCTFSVFMGLVDYSHCTLGNSEPKICKNPLRLSFLLSIERGQYFCYYTSCIFVGEDHKNLQNYLKVKEQFHNSTILGLYL